VDILLIWVRREAEYFCKWGWTGRHIASPADLPDGLISVIQFNKSPRAQGGLLFASPPFGLS
jgi:hypothetical protein